MSAVADIQCVAYPDELYEADTTGTSYESYHPDSTLTRVEVLEMVNAHDHNPDDYLTQLPDDQQEFLAWDVLAWLGY